MNFVERNVGRWFTVDNGYPERLPIKYKIEETESGYSITKKLYEGGNEMFEANVDIGRIFETKFDVHTCVLGHLTRLTIDIGRIRFVDEARKEVAA